MIPANLPGYVRRLTQGVVISDERAKSGIRTNEAHPMIQSIRVTASGAVILHHRVIGQRRRAGRLGASVPPKEVRVLNAVSAASPRRSAIIECRIVDTRHLPWRPMPLIGKRCRVLRTRPLDGRSDQICERLHHWKLARIGSPT